jgi:hypothetical protein
VSPENAIVVTVDLEDAFVGFDICFGWEDSLEVAYSAEFLLGLEEN